MKQIHRSPETPDSPTALEVEVAMCLVEAVEAWSADLRVRHEAALAGGDESTVMVAEGGDGEVRAA